MAKTPLIATASLLLALTFTISCSENGEDGDPSSSSVNDVNGESSSSIIANGGGNNSSSSSVSGGSSSSKTTSGNNNFESDLLTESYALRNVTGDSFIYVEADEYYSCEEGGDLVKVSSEHSEKINYSISNNVLAWEYEYNWNDDTLNFAGTSDNIIGTWTRTKDKNSSKYGYDIVKAEFTPSIVEITREFCLTERLRNDERRGWKYTATSCNTYELSKGADKITVEFNFSPLSEDETSFSATYKGKTCVDSETVDQRERACKRAWDEYGLTDRDWADYYWDFLESDFEECIKEKGFPEELFGDYDDGDSIGAVLAKPLPKKKHGNRVVTPGLRLLGPL